MLSLPRVDTIHLFPGERAALLALLRDLSPHEWNTTTVCKGWNVHDVALHLLGGDIGWLSGVAIPSMGARPRLRRPISTTGTRSYDGSTSETPSGWVQCGE